jgi:2,3-dihydroxybenzoate decarboxylase
MTAANRPFVIALEEHYSDAEVAGQNPRPATPQAAPSVGANMYARLQPLLLDIGDGRIAEMDANGIDVQVLSHVPGPVQQINAEAAVVMATAANNRLYEAVQRYPDRLAAFAMLPTPDATAAADELERCVNKLGFKGAMIHGRTQGLYHDDRKFRPIFERAQDLDVPIYLHPGPPHEALMQAIINDYAADFPALTNAAWGYTIDTASQALRMILSGLFDEYPRLKIILGHLGEALPFLVDRVDESINRGPKKVEFKRIFSENFYVTCSGHFSTPALLCTLLEVGIDHILFSIDYPFVENPPGMKWMETVPLSIEDKEKMFNGNARRLLKM